MLCQSSISRHLWNNIASANGPRADILCPGFLHPSFRRQIRAPLPMVIMRLIEQGQRDLTSARAGRGDVHPQSAAVYPKEMSNARVFSHPLSHLPAPVCQKSLDNARKIFSSCQQSLLAGPVPLFRHEDGIPQWGRARVALLAQQTLANGVYSFLHVNRVFGSARHPLAPGFERPRVLSPR